jgi:tetratricopeptide (TPR) repeat protein
MPITHSSATISLFRRISVCGLAALLTTTAALAQTPHEHHRATMTAADTVPLFDDLGSHHYPISSQVPLVQEYFDQGLRLYYAFNHAESIRAFEEAARRPTCAICHWGTAMAYGPNINLPMSAEAGAAAYAALQRARAQALHASEKERALIEALAARHSPAPGADRAALDSTYVRAMSEVADRFRDDPELRVLHAEAVMELSPWYYWTAEGEPRPGTRELVETLERVIEQNPNHPGACHFYIHAVEEVHPEWAVPCAERLAGLMPGAGHIVHMPAHIYIRVGRWDDAIAANEHAIHADETYIRDQRPGMGAYPLVYVPHNHDFLSFAAMMAGRGSMALQSARRVEAMLPEEMFGSPEVGGVLEHFSTGPLRVMVRLGAWDEILAQPAPPAERSYARAMWHYAQGMAHAARDDAEARADLAQVRRAAADPAMAERVIGFNTAERVLRIAAGVLAGEIAAREGNLRDAIAELRAAMETEDGLTYGEPPDWPVPVRQHLGPVLMQAGRYAEAEETYRQDLARFPENGWSLNGLAVSLRAQGRTAEAEEVQARFRKAWASADVSLPERRR